MTPSSDEELRKYKIKNQELQYQLNVFNYEISLLINSKFYKILIFGFDTYRKITKVFSKKIQEKLFRKIGPHLQLPALNEITREIGSATIAIPFFNNYYLIHNLISSILENDIDLIDEIIVSDDGSDVAESKLLLDLSLSCKKIRIIKNAINVGFKENSNILFKENKSKIMILVNSDVEFTNQTIRLLLEAFAKDERITLATPLETGCSSNLQLIAQNGEFWKFNAKKIESIEAKYPDVTTAVGYCLAINTHNLPIGKKLFTFNTKAYGEDTNLHYEVLSRNQRSVLVENCLVKHIGGQSYTSKFDFLRSDAEDKFLNKWGNIHSSYAEYFNILEPVNHLAKMVKYNTTFECDFLFLLPTNNDSIGGIKWAYDFIDHFRKEFENIKICVLEPTSFSANFDWDFLTLKDLDSITVKKCIFSVGLGTSDLALTLANKYDVKSATLIQGIDSRFSTFELGLRWVESLSRFDFAICNSTYTSGFASGMGLPHITFTMFPDKKLFYPGEYKQIGKAMVTYSNQFTKGSSYLPEILFKIKSNGFKIDLIGAPDDLDLDNFNNLFESISSKVSRLEMASLFRNSVLFIDLSISEGFGFMALEALMSGCQVLMFRRGGTESEISTYSSAITIIDPNDFMTYSNLNGIKLDLSIDDISVNSRIVKLNQSDNFEQNVLPALKKFIN
jgi:GT2 family glycosyltransferase